MFPSRGPRKVRDFLGRGGGAATSTSLASSLSQATDDEGAVVIGFGEPYNLACKVTSQIRFIRFREPLGEQELYSILFT